MALTSDMRDNDDAQRGAIAMHGAGEGTRYQVGDPGRYLAPGLFPALLTELADRGIDPAFGYSITLTDPVTGAAGRITGFHTGLPGVVVPDTGSRDLGGFTSETGHLAIAEMPICVEPAACDQCCWILINGAFSVVAESGELIATGEETQVLFSTRMEPMQHVAPLRRAA